MKSLIDNKSWIIYPESKNEKLQMIITFSNSSKYNTFINKLVTIYNGNLQKCNIGNDTRMVIIQNIYVLQLLSDIFTKDKEEYKKYSIYEDYKKIYSNQDEYFTDVWMI